MRWLHRSGVLKFTARVQLVGVYLYCELTAGRNPSIEAIASELAVDRRSVQRALRTLERGDVIRRCPMTGNPSKLTLTPL